MKCTVVVDNSVPISTRRPFRGEHGFSLLIEVASAKILLDTGQSEIVLHNLKLLGVQPNDLDAIALSHGHYDHTGGLAFLLQHRHKPIPVYAHPDIFQNHHSVNEGKRRYIGIPHTQEELSELGAQWNLTAAPREIVPGLMFSGQIPRRTDYETGDAKLVIAAEAGCDCQDPILDDAALYYSCRDGLAVIGGCAHSGLVNTVEYGLKLTANTQLAGWIGGTHLGPAPKPQQAKTLCRLAEYAPRLVAASHCTGFAMMAELQRRFGERFIPGFIGQVIQVD
ncbi:metallo-beta-lactamase [Lucifera butyrica]|uniref:Metallo-beta-lactamase n=1 Tax=Lucifera butyrica TaxID=1351585 RepID=A0A498RDP5_9FIRM|nr:MBL fold metallo-hydrolase [Lucifera butyrica]VBB09624.1 metallo-beta-lactamase [Lucifera butyrica]